MTGEFAVKAENSTLSGTLHFETGGGPISGLVTIQAPADPGNPPQLGTGAAATGMFDIKITLSGTFSGGPTGVLAGTADLSGSFTDTAGCAAAVSGVGGIDGDINMPLGIAFAWSEWKGLSFDGCGLSAEQPFSVEYLPFGFTPSDEIPQRAADAPPIPTHKDPAAIARRDRHSEDATDTPAGDSTSETGPGGTGSADTNPAGPGSSGTDPANTGSGDTGSDNTASSNAGSDDAGNAEGDVRSLTMTLEGAERTARAGEVVQPPFYLSNASDVANINFEVNYDPNVITPVDEPIKGNILSSGSLFAASARKKVWSASVLPARKPSTATVRWPRCDFARRGGPAIVLHCG